MKKLFLALPFLLAGCQAERVAFQFQPVAPVSAPAPASGTGQGAGGAVGQADEIIIINKSVTYTTNNVIASATLPAPERPTSRPPLAAADPALAAETTATLATPATPASTTSQLLVSKLLAKRLGRRHATAGPAHAAENGLGGIALFFIGVVLALLAGLGALVSLIFGTGFFTGVGFVAAGLVVLFLLYKLFSGGGKHKPAK